MAKKYEFAVKREILNSGKIIHIPVCREKLLLGRFNFFTNTWSRIVKIYDEYTLTEIDWTPDLSYEECEEHIKGYQKALLKKLENNVQTTEFHVLEEKEI